nr:AAA family ATPase [Nannocystis sp. SCPEA4]
MIDFGSERRSRHRTFFAREDVLSHIDAWLSDPRQSSGFLLLTGCPGIGKSAILSQWLTRRGQTPDLPPGEVVVPFHLIRGDVSDWGEPLRIIANLAAQVETLYPECADREARPEVRLRELLDRVSRRVLEPARRHLVLVIDGLDEASGADESDNPLPRFMPHCLPPWVFILCASRPRHPHLSWLDRRPELSRIDLDEDAWADSKRHACREFWWSVRSLVDPPLSSEQIEAVLERSEGNMLHSVYLYDEIRNGPPNRRDLESFPRGLHALLEEAWQRVVRLPDELRQPVVDGLGLLVTAREALPLEVVHELAGWHDYRIDDEFLRMTRHILLETKTEGFGHRCTAYRIFHESMREQLRIKLARQLAGYHRRIVTHLAAWPSGQEGFERRYATRYGVLHRIDARMVESASALCCDLDFVAARIDKGSIIDILADLQHVISALPEGEPKRWHQELAHALRKESHWLREPELIASALYNRLRNTGWTAEQLEHRLKFPGGPPRLRLRQPVETRDSSQWTLQDHGAPFTTCAVTPDGRKILSTSNEGALTLWEFDSGQELYTVHGHSASIEACAITPDGRLAITASADSTLKVWDIPAGQEIRTLEGHAGGASACAIMPDGATLVSGGSDGLLKLWDLTSGAKLRTFAGHSSVVTDCAVSPDRARIFSTSSDGTLKCWDTDTGDLLFSVDVGAVRDAKQEALDKILWQSFLEHLAILAPDADTSEPEHDALNKRYRGLQACALTAGAEQVVVAAADGMLRVLDAYDGHERNAWRAHESSIRSCSPLPDGKHVITASTDDTIKIWDVRSGCLTAELVGHTSDVIGCVSTPAGDRVVSCSLDDTLKIWALPKPGGVHRSSSRVDQDTAHQLALRPDGRHVVVAWSNGTIELRGLESNGDSRTLLRIEGENHSIRALSADGSRALVSSEDGVCTAWDTFAGQPLSVFDAGGRNYYLLSSDGRRAVTCSLEHDPMIKIWDCDSGRNLSSFRLEDAPLHIFTLTDDGNRLVSMSFDGDLEVRDCADGALRSSFNPSSVGLKAIVLLPDGKHVVCEQLPAEGDKSVVVWDLDARRRVSTVVDIPGTDLKYVRQDAVLSADGRHLALLSHGKRLLSVWDTATGRCLGAAPGDAPFYVVGLYKHVVLAGDAAGNLWVLDFVTV